MRKEDLLDSIYSTFIRVAFEDLPFSHLDGHVSEALMGFGSAADEEIYGKEGLRWIVERQLEQVAHLRKEIRRQTKYKTLFCDGNAALIVEEFEMLLYEGEEIIAFPFRMSTILDYKDNNWMVMHFHASVPDSNTPEGDAWSIDKLKRQNAELEKLVAEKTADLLAKNRELEIETAMERVRVKALAMQKSEDFMVTALEIFQVLNDLGLNPLRSGLSIMDEQLQQVEAWSVTRGENNTTIPLHAHFSTDVHPVSAEIFRHWKMQDPHWKIELNGDALRSFIEGMPRDYVPAGNGTGELPSHIKHIVFHYFSFSKGVVFAGSDHLFDAEETSIMQKFTGVFAFAYTRYLDLQQAEAQAREAHIQLALERVRARSMAMQKSDELLETSFLLFQQVRELGEIAAQVSIGIVNEESGFVELSTTIHGSHLPRTLNVPVDDPYVMAKAVAAWRAKQTSLTVEIEGQELKDYNEHRNSFFDKRIDFPEKQWIVNLAFFSKGWLSFSSDKNISGRTIEVLKRFAAVFEQTYVRFNDLKQAEAQAREAQIEASLERIRAKAMAMHQSEDLHQAVAVVFEELDRLNLDMLRCGIGIIDKEKRSADAWITSKSDLKGTVQVSGSESMDIHPLLQKAFNAWLRQEDLLYVLEGEDLTSYYRTSGLGNVRLPDSQLILSESALKHQYYYLATFQAGGLFAFREMPFTDEAIKIMKRFAGVFHLTYKRFLDLQKAEAQAKEAQIEAALERVRSRSLAMHKSDELKEVIKVLFEKLKELGFNFDGSGIQLFTEGSKDTVLWIAAPDHLSEPALINLPYSEEDFKKSELIRDIWKAKEEKGAVYNKTYSYEEKNLYFDYVGRHNDMTSIPAAVREFQMQVPGYTATVVMEKNSSLWVDSWSEKTISAVEFNVLKRFLKVFEQSYIRFLDLQRAEVQAKEARIEVALERVRARTMAMHKSEELAEASGVLFHELHSVGIETIRSGFGIFDEEMRSVEAWMTTLSNNLMEQKVIGIIPITAHPAITANFNAWKQNQTFLCHEFANEDVKQYYKALAPFVTLPEQEKPLEKEIFYAFFFPEGSINVITDQLLSEEQSNIILRFARVFGLTYRRFRDLQLAEAQAREAQIEAALERVRSRTMGMQKSEELKEVIQVVYAQFVQLNIDVEHTGFVMDYKARDDYHIWIADKVASPTQLTIPYFDCVYYNQFNEAKENGVDFFATNLTFEEKNRFYQDLFKHVPGLPEEALVFLLQSPGLAISTVLLENVCLYIENFSGIPYTDEENATLMRFGRVFQQTYTRFLDLQKAEAQARESQIQLALERVRARTMAMQKSDELPEAANLLFQQMQSLGMPAWSAGYCIWDEDKKAITLWMSSEGVLQPPFKLPLTEDPSCMHFLEAHQRGETFYVEEIGGEDLITHYNYMRSLPVVGEVLQSINDAGFPLPTFQIFHCAYFSKGFLLFITYEPVPEAHDIFKRFGKVFDQTYTRFLDLQKAEAQARESRIEAALERVRARSMGMHKSDELNEVITLVFEQLRGLDIFMHGAMIHLFEDHADYFELWLQDSVYSFAEKLRYTFIDNPIISSFITARNSEQPIITDLLSKEKKDEFFEFSFEHSDLRKISDDRKKLILTKPGYARSIAVSTHMALAMDNFDAIEYTDEENKILLRFAKVFEQTYTRFLDLQKAEAQARESQIEAALERVRARSMGMHKSDELNEVITLVFEQLRGLDIFMHGAMIYLFDDPDGDFNLWLQDSVYSFAERLHFAFLDHPFFTSLINARNSKQPIITDLLNKEQKDEFFEFSLLHSDLKKISEERRSFVLAKPGYARSIAVSTHMAMAMDNFDAIEYTDEENKILLRFAKVFEQTYTRFLDLQKAEAQAREAQIEASLERVRSKAMAMHKSDDLASAVATVFEELDRLNLGMLRCGIGIIDKEKQSAEIWTTTQSAQGKVLQVSGDEPLNIHPLLQGAFDSWLALKDFSYELKGQDLVNYYKAVADTNFQLPDTQTQVSGIEELMQYYHLATFTAGGLYAFGESPFTEEAKTLMRRFADVFNLTYTRYNDLQKAETQAREAVKQASLDRVRAQIASMRSTQDLQRITPLIWQELTNLQITFVRCGVFIMDDEAQIVHTYLSTPDGKDIAAIHLPYVGQHVTEQVVAHWKRQTIYAEHWTKEDFHNWTTQLVKQGFIKSEENYQAGSAPEQLHLHFVPFAQGMLYVGSTEPLPEESLNLIHALAEAFSTAYARYEDFNRLEAAKKKTDIALADLEAAKDQLVQQEKLASLGQLTAGIAHEIKNPLNFVNNFSEVSMELLDEMLQELAKGNPESVKSITDDIKSNLDKIHEHGSRADSIVKSMLMHSRGGSGQKEPTDLNALIREYVNLTFHGMRASKHPINVQIDLKLDESLGLIPVIIEDLSRVIINLCNNAFDAMRSKLSDPSQIGGYTPKLTVRTKRDANHVIVEIADNGPGIPEDIKDKILQPFFTTKKGTQGTGLGLSITNDIVKAHGGELKVESKEGEGSEFIIQLPLV